MVDVEVHEHQRGEDCGAHDPEPEPALPRPHASNDGREQQDPEQTDNGRQPLEDEPPHVTVESLPHPPVVPPTQVPARQPLGDRARRLDSVGVPCPQRQGCERHPNRDHGQGVEAPTPRAFTCGGPVGETRDDPEEGGRRLHEHADEARHQREHEEHVLPSLAPEDERPCETDRSSGCEVFDHRRSAPDNRERSERECDERSDPADGTGHVPHEPVEQQRGQQEAR